MPPSPEAVAWRVVCADGTTGKSHPHAKPTRSLFETEPYANEIAQMRDEGWTCGPHRVEPLGVLLNQSSPLLEPDEQLDRAVQIADAALKRWEAIMEYAQRNDVSIPHDMGLFIVGQFSEALTASVLLKKPSPEPDEQPSREVHERPAEQCEGCGRMGCLDCDDPLPTTAPEPGEQSGGEVHESLTKALRENIPMFETCRDAISSLPIDALGVAPETSACPAYPIRDEVLASITKSITRIRAALGLGAPRSTPGGEGGGVLHKQEDQNAQDSE